MQIEKNIPIPQKSKYPFADMKVGDSFFVDAKDNSKPQQGSLLALAKRWSIRYNPGAKFSTRQEGKGFRMWRIK